MQSTLNLRLVAALAISLALVGLVSGPVLLAQTAPAAADLSEPTIKALQHALNKQGIAVKADGVLNDETRAAIRKYQSQHHLPVTGEPDKAFLDKLGVRQSAAPQSSVVAQAPPAAQAPTDQRGMMMNCPMMQESMPGMMQMQQGMMGMMQGMHPQRQSEQMEQMQGMMRGMMQMMQSMMGMMQSQMMRPQSAPSRRQND
jgi:hypothetical protein